MPVNPAFAGRRYGPFRYEVGLEAIRDFALAVSGGVPGRVSWAPPGGDPHPFTVDEGAGAGSPWGSVVAPPTFAAVFAMEAFSTPLADPGFGADLSRLLHGEQELELLGVIRPGDVVETVGEIAAVTRKAALDVVVVVTTTTNQRGEVVVRGRWTAVFRDRA
ncbi:MAG TPA: MaoC family dehydratase N-terminal domain-containing protein [Anaeromyxobacteraceae bacterium]